MMPWMLPVFRWVLCVSVFVLHGKPCIYVCMYICGDYVCSVCICQCGVHFQLHYWLDLRPLQPPSLSQADLSSTIYFPLTPPPLILGLGWSFIPMSSCLPNLIKCYTFSWFSECFELLLPVFRSNSEIIPSFLVDDTWTYQHLRQ